MGNIAWICFFSESFQFYRFALQNWAEKDNRAAEPFFGCQTTSFPFVASPTLRGFLA